MEKQSRFAQRTFFFAAIYGFISLIPQYFLESQLVPPITHPEQFYGFVGVALAWQFAFLLISRDVARYRLLMPIAVIEKLAFGVPVLLLYLQGRVPAPVLGVGFVELLLATLFAVAFFTVRSVDAGDKQKPV